MHMLVVYYSLTGYTRALAERVALERQADLVQIQEVRRRSVVGAFVFGAFLAMCSRPSRIAAMQQDFGLYDRIVLASPVWAASAVPAAVAFIQKYLPAGKDVEVILCSGSGESGQARERLRKIIEKAGSRLVVFQDVKAAPQDHKTPET